jgi:hypothetical protein
MGKAPREVYAVLLDAGAISILNGPWTVFCWNAVRCGKDEKRIQNPRGMK